MVVETTKMSSRGQVVIPQDIREEIKAGEGTIFAVLSSDNTIILKKMEIPSKDSIIRDLDEIASEGRKRAEKLGIKESDVPRLIHKMRGVKE